MKVIGLTGGIATGKSTVSNLLKDLNIPVVDTDHIAHELLLKGNACYESIVTHFGSSILREDLEIDRKQLGIIIFNNEKERAILNSIVHPEVHRVCLEKIAHYKSLDKPIVVLDVPLLYESEFDKIVDLVIVVSVDPLTQLKRLMQRNNFTEDEATVRIQAQMPLKDKEQMAHYIIDNSKDLEYTKKQVTVLMESLGISV